MKRHRSTVPVRSEDSSGSHCPCQQISGYEYEFREAVRCIREGKLQPDSMPLETTVQVMEIMDSLRKKWGVVYPQER